MALAVASDAAEARLAPIQMSTRDDATPMTKHIDDMPILSSESGNPSRSLTLRPSPVLMPMVHYCWSRPCDWLCGNGKVGSDILEIQQLAQSRPSSSSFLHDDSYRQISLIKTHADCKIGVSIAMLIVLVCFAVMIVYGVQYERRAYDVLGELSVGRRDCDPAPPFMKVDFAANPTQYLIGFTDCPLQNVTRDTYERIKTQVGGSFRLKCRAADPCVFEFVSYETYDRLVEYYRALYAFATIITFFSILYFVRVRCFKSEYDHL